MQLWFLYFKLFFCSEECSSRGGTNDGQCASGFGVCCTCKLFHSTLELARIAWKFTRSTKIEIEMLEKKFARFLLGSKEDRKFYARDRSDRNSMLEMIARKLQLKLDKERLKIFALFEFGNWDKYVVFIHFSKLIRNYSNSLKYFIEDGVDSRFSYIMLEKWLFLLEKCSVLLENFFRT